MFTNLLTPEITNHINKKKSSMDASDKKILEILMEEVENLRNRNSRTLSTEAKSIVGFNREKGDPRTATSVFQPILKKIDLNLNFSFCDQPNDKIIDDVIPF